MTADWDKLVATAADLGFSVELVEYCESSESPGLLGAALGVCIYDIRLIRIRQALHATDRCFVLEHELDHARNIDAEAHVHAELDKRFHSEYEARHQTINEYIYPET
jgi:hypothetical protein